MNVLFRNFTLSVIFAFPLHSAYAGLFDGLTKGLSDVAGSIVKVDVNVKTNRSAMASHPAMLAPPATLAPIVTVAPSRTVGPVETVAPVTTVAPVSAVAQSMSVAPVKTLTPVATEAPQAIEQSQTLVRPQEVDVLASTPSIPAKQHTVCVEQKENLADTLADVQEFRRFCEEWEKLNDEYQRLSEELGCRGERILMANMDGKRMVVERTGGESVSSEFSSLLASQFCLTSYANFAVCPALEKDLAKFIAETRKLYEKSIKSLRQSVELRERCYGFCAEWEAMHKDYNTLLSRFGEAKVDLLKPDFGGATIVFRKYNQAKVSSAFVALLASAYNLGPEEFGKWPSADAEMDQFIDAVKALYAQRIAPLKKVSDEVHDLVVKVGETRSALSGRGSAVAKSLRLLGFVDPDQADDIEGRIRQMMYCYRDLSSNEDDYLRDDEKRKALSDVEKKSNEIQKDLFDKVVALEANSEALLTKIKPWRDENSWQAMPKILGIPLCSTSYEVGTQLVATTMFAQKPVEKSKVECRNETECVVGRVEGHGEAQEIRLTFAGGDSAQGAILIGGYYSLDQSLLYADVVNQFEKDLSGSSQKEVTRRIAGYDVDELRKRHPWAAWQMEYYGRRSERLLMSGRIDAANMHKIMIGEVAERSEALKFWQSSTIFTGNGCRIQVDSNVGETAVEKVQIRDVLAASKLK